MVKLTINNINVEVPEGTSILDAARTAGIEIPTLCYLKEINEIGACRVCVVEVEGIDRVVTACNNTVKEGMVVHTNSNKARTVRKTNVKLILSQHDFKCATCVRSGNCSLQKIARDLNITDVPYESIIEKSSFNENFPLIRNAEKCIKCMRCVQICDKVQSLKVWDVVNTGARTTVDVSNNVKLEEANCSLCGQCLTHCPVAALRERDDVDRAIEAIENKDLITVVQIAPAIRTAWGEQLGLERENATVNRLVDGLRKVGFNYIFDTSFSADLTIMEEGSEFIEKLPEIKKSGMPMFTSCCPGWVRFVKSEYPYMVEYLSSAKSPQQMFGAITKSYYAKLLNVDPSKIYCVSIMPCLAKKHECDIPNINDAEAFKDVDVVLTTREVVRLLKSYNIKAENLKEVPFDEPLGTHTGAGVIFGATGGVMEAALRSAYYLVTKQNPDADAFEEVRGMDAWKEAEFKIADVTVKVAVVSGLANARRLMDAIISGKVQYDFVEVMACPGGCVNGGGQPIHDGQELAGQRAKVLYGLDKHNNLRFSHENPAIQECYKSYLGEPLSHLAHKLLHTDHTGWNMPK
ncbi:NADH-quinone oxidoreductase subunit G [Hathewaya proteolytica DSM 3090]|uniref:NADH-quinone oxidoreductase subunit G n=1 Tax=Hathewaya proteolytica DSM 3090 TaxID=1121331 RepID=A0A1M6QXP6_9CLOT|nr:[FeFe] hydrogenase, group A [Hathewaya proteolytica]SHK25052.1 NADH-quinone oxidoreductase subunit G [Hathewaya proteolytica DSM 3090]